MYSYDGPRHRNTHLNTKMLIAGWGRCGIPVAQATRSQYHMLVDESYGRSSGECAGRRLNREAKDPGARREALGRPDGADGGVLPNVN